eukprot:m.39085 g.39085  ORF g.39085 m.39085 type:complete len:77 (-) comp10280_c0_seq3:29-259(-)
MVAVQRDKSVHGTKTATSHQMVTAHAALAVLHRTSSRAEEKAERRKKKKTEKKEKKQQTVAYSQSDKSVQRDAMFG